MDTTIFLMQLWGPILLALGCGFFTSRKYYERLYRDLDKQSFAVFIFAIIAIAAGIAQVHAHNTWNTLPEIIISILGWGTLIKGFIFAIAPKFVDRTAEKEAKMNLIPLAGICMILVGAYLTIVGF